MNTGELYDTMNELAISMATTAYDHSPKSCPGDTLAPGLKRLAEAMGLCVAVWAEYRGDMIMEVAISALEDANYPVAAAQLQEMLVVE